MVRRATEALATLARAPVPVAADEPRRARRARLRLLPDGPEREGRRRVRASSRASSSATDAADTLAAADAWNNWALVHHRGDIRKAEPLYRRALEIHRSIDGEDGIEPVALHNYAGVLHELGRYREAEPIFRDAVRRARERQNTFVEIAGTLELAGMLAENGRLPDARATIATLDRTRGRTRSPRCAARFSPTPAESLAIAAGRRSGGPGRVRRVGPPLRAIPAKFSGDVLALVGLSRSELAVGKFGGRRGGGAARPGPRRVVRGTGRALIPRGVSPSHSSAASSSRCASRPKRERPCGRRSATWRRRSERATRPRSTRAGRSHEPAHEPVWPPAARVGGVHRRVVRAAAPTATRAGSSWAPGPSRAGPSSP